MRECTEIKQRKLVDDIFCFAGNPFSQKNLFLKNYPLALLVGM